MFVRSNCEHHRLGTSPLTLSRLKIGLTGRIEGHWTVWARSRQRLLPWRPVWQHCWVRQGSRKGTTYTTASRLSLLWPDKWLFATLAGFKQSEYTTWHRGRQRSGSIPSLSSHHRRSGKASAKLRLTAWSSTHVRASPSFGCRAIKNPLQLRESSTAKICERKSGVLVCQFAQAPGS